jgi:abortive infection bacteriophage resistance protein
MSDLVADFLKNINVSQLIAMGLITWFFYSRLNSKIEKVDNDLKNLIDKGDNSLKEEMKGLKEEFKNLTIVVSDIDRRVCRIEGNLNSHGHCLFNQAQPEKKAE